MTNKFNSFYLTLLVVLAGALILGSGVTALATSADESPDYVKAGATDVLMLQFDVNDSTSDGDSASFSAVTVEDTGSDYSLIDTVYVLDHDKTQIASKAMDSGSESISVSETIPAGDTNNYYIAIDVASGVSDGDSVGLEVTGVTGTDIGYTDPGSVSATADTIAPVYDSAITGHLATGESTKKKKIYLAFTEARSGLDYTSVEPGDFSVTGATVDSVDSNDDYIVLTLEEALGTGATPDVELTGTVEDNAGNVAATDTKTASDGLKPELDSATTTSTTTVKVTFSEGLSTVLGSAFFTWQGTGTVTDVSQVSSGVYSLKLDDVIGTAETADVDLDSNVQDAVGNTLSSGVSVTADDGLAPTFDSASATSTTNINASFSEYLDADTVAAADFSVEGYTVEEAALASTPGSTVALTIASEMPTDATPKVTLVGSVADSSGNALSGDKVNFATDSISPVLEKVIWFDEDSSGSLNDNDKLKFRFSEPMDTTSIDNSNDETRLDPDTGSFSSDSVSWSNDKRSVTVTLTGVTSLTTDNLQVNPTSDVNDLATNSDATPYSVGLTAVTPVTVVNADGTTESYSTIQKAITNADSGETVKVPDAYAGTYESFPIDVDTDNLTIEAAEGASPVVDATTAGDVAFELAGSNIDVTFDGLKIIGPKANIYTPGNAIDGFRNGFSGTLTVKDSTFVVNSDAGSDNNAAIVVGQKSTDGSTAANVDIQNSTFKAGSYTTGYISGIWTKNLDSTNQDVIKDNEFKNLTLGMQTNDTADNVIIENNYFHDLTLKEAIWIGADSSIGNYYVVGNTFEDVPSGIRIGGSVSSASNIDFNNFINASAGSTYYSTTAEKVAIDDANGNANIGANWWGADTGPVAAQLGTNVSVSDATPFLKAKVEASEFAKSAGELDDSTLGAYINDPSDSSGELELLRYSSSPHTQAVDAIDYFRVADSTANSETQLRFYTDNPNAVAIYWNGSEWVEASDQAYDVDGGYVTVTLDSSGSTSTIPDEDDLPADFAIAGIPAGSSARDMDMVQGWQMVGLGFMPDDDTPSAVFGENLGSTFVWDPAAGEYVNGTELSAATPEEGFWFYSTSEKTVGLGTGADIQEDYDVEFEDGNGSWLMFSVPFNVNWSQVRFGDTLSGGVAPDQAQADGLIQNQVYTYNNSTESYDKVAFNDDTGSNVGMLEADKSYWITVEKDATAEDPLTMWVPYAPGAAPSMTAAAQATIVRDVPESASTPPAPPAAPQKAAEGLEATAAVSADGVTFEVAGADVSSINVQVFSANGEQIRSLSASGDSVSWDANVANGLYLYGVSAEVDGEVTPLGVQKLLILE